MKQSAGILVFRNRKNPEVFLVHPGGPFWKNKDEGAWSIPKGEPGSGEDLLLAAQREFKEETGQELKGHFLPLSPVRLKSGKLIHAWAVEAEVDAGSIRSNQIEIEWPPRSGKKIKVPEVDRGSWFAPEEAIQRINPAQAALIIELLGLLTKRVEFGAE